MEYFPLQGMNVIVILVLDKQSGSLTIHTKIAPVINIGKLRNKQFLLGLDYVVKITFTQYQVKIESPYNEFMKELLSFFCGRKLRPSFNCQGLGFIMLPV